MSAGVDIDPLDAYMDSIAFEVTQQATEPSTPSPPSPPPTSSLLLRRQLRSPSPAQREIAAKVSASPFCDVLTSIPRGAGDSWEHRAGSSNAADAASQPNGGAGGGGGGGGGGDSGEAPEACLRLLLADPAKFLSRFGHILSPADLESLLPSQNQDPAVALHVARLRALMLSQHQRQQQQQQQAEGRPVSLSAADEDVDMPSAPTTTPPAAGREAGAVGGGGAGGGGGRARVRNRRYRRLKQLADGGVWFSDEAMKERDPWLWFEYVGRRAGEEKPAPKQAVEQVPGSTSVGTYLQESLRFLSQPQPDGGWDTGVPAAEAGGSRGMGSSLGMAFLSGVCCADAGTPHVRAGATVDLSHIPPAYSTGEPAAAAAAAVTSQSPGLPNASNNGVYAGQADADDEMDTSTAAVTAAVGAIGIGGGAADEAGGVADSVGADGGATTSQNRENGGSHARRVRFVDEGGANLGGGGVDDRAVLMQEEEEEEEEGEEVGGGREKVARVLWERFLAGLEEGVNYKSVDEDERLDDLDQLARDEQDRWFRGEEDS